ncbi:MAG: response regulator transcription factor [Oscillospiraceae bacterium]|nr:response regulator transcription factor [Oscillospiraceae bacterium]
MKRFQIALCDTNKQELEGYATVCRGICEKNGLSADFKLYASSGDLLFDMGPHEFTWMFNIFIIDPENGFSDMPSAIRRVGYNGVILYLSHSKSPEHYQQAFDAGAYNFIEKGTEPQLLFRFQSVFEAALQTAKQIDRQFLMVSCAGELRRIEVKDIHYFESAADHMVNVVYNGGSFQFLSTMKGLEERFRDRGFVRVHRSYLVSVDAIHRVEPGTLTLNSGRRILVSRDRYPALKTAMFCWQT